MSPEREPTTRDRYKVFYQQDTRWSDNDQYGHVNNVVYYAYFDTAVNRFLIEEGGLDPHDGDIVGYVVHSNCHYQSGIAYPDRLDVGISVEKLGSSSVTYRIGVFKQGDEKSSAHGSFVHVFVDRATEKPTEIPEKLRAALSSLLDESN